jgi:hypothetical protein
MIDEINKYNLKLRLVEFQDADFILQLRVNQKLNQYISVTSSVLSDQIKWIEQYKIREVKGLEYYFIALDEDGIKLGTTRIYNIENNCFEIGSWLFSEEAPLGASIKADLITREFGFESLGFEYCKFEVRKANLKVLKYHYKFNPELIGEDDLNYFFRLSRSDFKIQSQKLIKFL